jgi:hypothetical protein
MNNISGDKEFVLKLLRDTARNLTVRHPEIKPSGKKKGITAKALAPKTETQQVERDQIIERFQRAYETAQLQPTTTPVSTKKGKKKIGKALSAPTATVVEDQWYAPRDRTIAVFQSAIDEYVDQHKPKPKGAKAFVKQVSKTDASKLFYKKKAKKTTTAKGWVGEQFDNLDPGWLGVVYQKAKLLFKGKHKFIKHSSLKDLRYSLQGNPVTIALIADWGGGNNHAQAVSNEIRKRNPDYVIHLGDVYYAGTDDEVKKRFLNLWPGSLTAGRSFALNSNHEMYSGGYAYFDTTLPKFGQKASYFCLENSDWRFIGLDTGYIEHDLNVEQMEWLSALVNESDKKNILMSHHQAFSAYESSGAGEERLQNWVKDITNKITGWFWGHEHLCVVYKSYKGIKGRCIGHGCFPYDIPAVNPPYAGPQVDWVLRAGDPKFAGRGTLGFAWLELNGKNLKVSYINEGGTTQHQETF